MATKGKRKKTKVELVLRTFFDAQPLHEVGASYMLVIPKLWLEVYGEQIDGRYWVKREENYGQISIKPISPGEVAEMMEVASVETK